MSNAVQGSKGMQFSLRSFLIAVLVLGVVLGVLGRLFRVEPELGLIILYLGSTIGPFLAAVVTVIWLGYHRGRGGSDPVCASCRCDLSMLAVAGMTNCPQCNADLSAAGALEFVPRPTRSGRLITWGFTLLLMPAMGVGLVFVAQMFMVGSSNSPQGLGRLSTQQLIEQRLPKQVDEPWVWNELGTRLAAGQLSPAEVDDALEVLITHMKTTKPDGWDSPFHWQDEFLEAAEAAGAISDPVMVDLCDAFFGSKPRLDALPRLREGADQFRIEIGHGNTWDSHSGLGVRLLWDVTRITLDGKPVEYRMHHKSDTDWNGQCNVKPAVGKHEVVVEVECAYINRDQLVGLNTRDLPAKHWPEGRKRWKTTTTGTLEVFSPNEPIVSLTTDPNLDPERAGAIRITRLVVQPDRNGRKRVVLNTELTGDLPVSVSFDVTAVIDGESIAMGSMYCVRSENWSTSSGSNRQKTVEALAPDVTFADIVLTPNPKHVEQIPRAKEIWGEKVVITAVPIDRFDLP